jgi:thiol:disulfide interchange protein DsbD
MYPMIPILSSIIVGQGEHVSALKGFSLSGIYVLSLAVTFGIVGAITAAFASGVGVQAYFQNPLVLSLFALLFIALAFSMFGFYDIQVPAALQNKLSSISNQQKGGTFIGVAIMGALSALIIGPCGGPALAAMLTYAAASSSLFKGFTALFALGLGMGMPLLLVGAGGGKILPKAGNWMTAVKAGAGVILLAVALIILERMPHLYSPLFTMMLWAMLLIISGIYLGAFSSTEGKSGWYTFWKGLGLFLVFYGVLVMIGGQLGGKTVTDPFYGVSLSSPKNSANGVPNGSETSSHVSFKRIKTIQDLKREIASAKSQNKAVMLDFYADWCGYCIQYERYVFPSAKVKSKLEKIVLLQADVTAMDETDTELMKTLGVSLPPAILFFGVDGKEIPSSRIVGEMNEHEFSAHLEKILKR